MKNGIQVILFFFFLFTCHAQAQVLRASVSVDYQHLPVDEQQYLNTYKNTVEDYFNNYAWTEDEYESDIEINIYIIIETVTKKSYERIYKSQFQIKSTSGESFYDKDWEFPYQPGYALEHNKMQFDPLSHFFDFYANLVLGGDNNAQDLANRGILSQYSRGWSNRLNELQKITHSYTLPLRQVKPDFFYAAYMLQLGKTKEARIIGLKVMGAIEKVVHQQPNNKYLKMFFDAHYVTFAEIFRGDLQNLELLIKYDSPHRETYQEMINQ
jgi:hypothetical protein